MKVSRINSSPSFKAKLSPEVHQGLYSIARKTIPTSVPREKLLKNIAVIFNSMPHVSLSIKKLNQHGEEVYGFVLSNPKTGRNNEIGPFIKNPKDLFNEGHIDNIKWALLDEKNAESGVKKINQHPYLDIFE